MAQVISSAEFDEKVLKAQGPVLVDFFATWCGPCKMLAPTIDAVAAEMEGKAGVYKIDVDQSPDIAGKYGVMSVPTLIVFENGQIKNQTVGAQLSLPSWRCSPNCLSCGLAPAHPARPPLLWPLKHCLGGCLLTTMERMPCAACERSTNGNLRYRRNRFGTGRYDRCTLCGAGWFENRHVRTDDGWRPDGRDRPYRQLPGFPEGVGGFDLSMAMMQQDERFGVTSVNEEVTAIETAGTPKTITTAGATYQARALIVATGARSRTMGVDREGELTGCGVSYCATCDGNFFKDKPVIVVGGGNTAAADAVYLARICPRCTWCTVATSCGPLRPAAIRWNKLPISSSSGMRWSTSCSKRTARLRAPLSKT